MDGDVQNKKVPWIQGSTRKVSIEMSKQLPSAEGSVGGVNNNTITGNVGIHSPKATPNTIHLEAAAPFLYCGLFRVVIFRAGVGLHTRFKDVQMYKAH